MSGTELQVLEIIWDWGGEASVDIMAREASISTDYARLLCESLGRNDYVDFLYQKQCRIRGKGELEVARRKCSTGRGHKKIIIPERFSRFGFSRDKRGRLILGY